MFKVKITLSDETLDKQGQTQTKQLDSIDFSMHDITCWTSLLAAVINALYLVIRRNRAALEEALVVINPEDALNE